MRIPSYPTFVFIYIIVRAASFIPNIVSTQRKPNRSFTRFNERIQFTRSTLFLSSKYQATLSADVKARLGLNDRFGRWRYLQNLLDGEFVPDDVNDVLYIVLSNYLSSKQPGNSGGHVYISIETTEDQICTLQTLTKSTSNAKIQELLMTTNENDLTDSDILENLESILPCAIEYEDENKGLWDTIIEIHGREAVKIDERNNSFQWKARCLITRVLLFYDFLPYGL